VGDHAGHWHLAPGAGSSLENVRAAILANGQPWGELQLSFRPVVPRTLLGWLSQPVMLGVALMSVLGLVVFQLYLRRAMRYLDPSHAVPERVRAALDTLTEGVLVLDTSHHVLLANHAFCALAPEQAELAGAHVSALPCLMREAGRIEGGLPWQRALAENRAQLGHRLQIEVGGRLRQVVMNCSPINEGGGRARGCLLTFADVTELHERTERLRETLADLEVSREQIRLKNEELMLLATRDPLTGCLNRRAFLEESQASIDAARESGEPLSCIMCDIDHFKLINDCYGHGGGDQVLQAVSRALGRGLRTGDLLGRYGGEEFCILLPSATLEQARVIAERLRVDIEANAGAAARQLDGVRVTMSFGIEQIGLRTDDFSVLVDLADQALYHSKENGRNRVTAWSDMPGRGDVLPVGVVAAMQ